MDKGLILWGAFLAILAAGMLISRMIKRGILKNGIETDAVVSRIVDCGTQDEINLQVYVTYRTEDGETLEGLLSNPRADLTQGQRVRVKYHPTMKTNARLV